jgi:hypothetical protein
LASVPSCISVKQGQVSAFLAGLVTRSLICLFAVNGRTHPCSAT